MIICGKEVLLLLGIIQCLTHSTVEGEQNRRVRRHTNFETLLEALQDRIAALEEFEHEEEHDHHATLFAVSLSQGNMVQTGDPIVYNQVSLNREEGYNSTTGVFTCPIAGVYFFTYSCLPALGVETSVAFLKNGIGLSNIHTILPGGSTQQAERSELILLQLGDTVSVVLEIGSLLNNGNSLKFTGYRVSD